jgi:hypothetical protein
LKTIKTCIDKKIVYKTAATVHRRHIFFPFMSQTTQDGAEKRERERKELNGAS